MYKREILLFATQLRKAKPISMRYFDRYLRLLYFDLGTTRVKPWFDSITLLHSDKETIKYYIFQWLGKYFGPKLTSAWEIEDKK